MNPYVHQVAKAAGISDLSAKVYGSRNPTRVIKLAVSMLHGGSNPIGKPLFLSFFPPLQSLKKTKKMYSLSFDRYGRIRKRKGTKEEQED